MTIRLRAIYRYPVKGLNGEPLDRIALEAGKRLPGDRAFALAHGSAPWQAGESQWLPPKFFHSLRSEPRLAQLAAQYDSETSRLTLQREGRVVARGELNDPLGRTIIGQFFADFLGPDGRGVPKVVAAGPDSGLTDVPDSWISLLNLDTVDDLGRVARRELDPRRFRANLWISGAGAWKEREWVGREVQLGAVRLRVVEMIERCAATNVNLESAERDINLPLLLQRGYGHRYMGVYCMVVQGGEIAVGEELQEPAE